MINDIKLDKIGFSETPKVRQDAPTKVLPEKTDGITISNHLTKMVDMLSPENADTNAAEQVKAMKKRIESNNYTVDLDALSGKLVHHLFNGI